MVMRVVRPYYDRSGAPWWPQFYDHFMVWREKRSTCLTCEFEFEPKVANLPTAMLMFKPSPLLRGLCNTCARRSNRELLEAACEDLGIEFRAEDLRTGVRKPPQ